VLFETVFSNQRSLDWRMEVRPLPVQTAPSTALSPACPNCKKSQHVRFTVRASHGWDCYCDACADAWYYEDQPPPDPFQSTR